MSEPAAPIARDGHRPFEARHRDDLEWETIRWPGETGKMLFHPRPERPTEPNAGILRLEPAPITRCTGTISRRSGTSWRASSGSAAAPTGPAP